MPSITVALLARELAVRPNAVLQMATTVGLHITRVGALLTQSQADRIRAHAAARVARQVRAAAAPPPPRPGAPRAMATVAAPRPAQPTVGPDHACDCCGMRLQGTPPSPEEEAEPARCSACAAHFEIEGEDADRVQERLRDHDERLRHAYAVLWTRLRGTEDEKQRGFRSRNSWRGALVEVMEGHEEVGTGGCSCGAKAFPCATWKGLQRANRGVLQQVEDFLAMKDDERDRRLYGRDHWDHDVA